MSNSGPKKIIRLKSSDNKVFDVEEATAIRSEHIKRMIEDVDCYNDIIPLANIKSDILEILIWYCTKRNEVESSGDEELKEWESKLVDLDNRCLSELVMAANFLDIKDLLDLTCQAFADKIKDKMPEEVRRMFNIVNDFTPEEEKAIHDQHPWAYQI